jgi:hypothetical protein
VYQRHKWARNRQRKDTKVPEENPVNESTFSEAEEDQEFKHRLKEETGIELDRAPFAPVPQQQSYQPDVERLIAQINFLTDQSMRVNMAVTQLYAVLTDGRDQRDETMQDADILNYLVTESRAHFARLQAELNRRSEIAAQAQQKVAQVREEATTVVESLIKLLR